MMMMNKTHSGEERGTNGYFDLYLDNIYFNVFIFLGKGRDLNLQYFTEINPITRPFIAPFIRRTSPNAPSLFR